MNAARLPHDGISNSTNQLSLTSSQYRPRDTAAQQSVDRPRAGRCCQSAASSTPQDDCTARAKKLMISNPRPGNRRPQPAPSRSLPRSRMKQHQHFSPRRHWQTSTCQPSSSNIMRRLDGACMQRPGAAVICGRQSATMPFIEQRLFTGFSVRLQRSASASSQYAPS